MIGIDDYRLDVLREIGQTIYPLRPPLRRRRSLRPWERLKLDAPWLRWIARSVDWNPPPLAVELRKARLIADLSSRLREAERLASIAEASR